jgi:hypothetical protein
MTQGGKLAIEAKKNINGADLLGMLQDIKSKIGVVISPLLDGIRCFVTSSELVGGGQEEPIPQVPRGQFLRADRASGFYPLEYWSDVQICWMQADATLTVFSLENHTTKLTLLAKSFYRPRSLKISSSSGQATRVTIPSGVSIKMVIHSIASIISLNPFWISKKYFRRSRLNFTKVTVPVTLSKGVNIVRLHVLEGCDRPCDIAELNNPDPRCLSIAVLDIILDCDDLTCCQDLGLGPYALTVFADLKVAIETNKRRD